MCFLLLFLLIISYHVIFFKKIRFVLFNKGWEIALAIDKPGGGLGGGISAFQISQTLFNIDRLHGVELRREEKKHMLGVPVWRRWCWHDLHGTLWVARAKASYTGIDPFFVRSVRIAVQKGHWLRSIWLLDWAPPVNCPVRSTDQSTNWANRPNELRKG